MAKVIDMHVLGGLTKDNIRSLEIASNRVMCAEQALRPNAVPSYVPISAVDKFFREAIFALADAQYLQDSFWRDLARQHNIAEKDMGKLSVDLDTKELLLKD